MQSGKFWWIKLCLWEAY